MAALEARIGLNLIFLVPGETGGMEIAARELIPALLDAAPPGWRFTAFINREAAASGGGPWGELLPAVTVPVNARSRAQWVAGEQTLLPALAARHRVQLLHSLANTAPLWGPFRGIVTVHDLIYARYPEAHAGVRARVLGTLVPAAVRRSDRVIVISQSTRSDLLALTRADPARIDVVPQGLGIVARAQPLAAAEARARFDLGSRQVVLTLSAKRPHKNLATLIDAMAVIPADRRPLLLLPGYPTWHESELRERAARAGVSDDVRFLGWVAGVELETLWSVADAFVFPSFYEGFGLPVLEAMARGVPVACADASSLPEVAGEAALLFDPNDSRAIAAAIERLLTEPALAERLVALGRERARLFTWEHTARLTLDSYAAALGPPS